MWDNSNMQEDCEWGNIELPGISDEELLNTNWNLKESHREHAERIKKWHKENPEFRKKFEAGMADLKNDPKKQKLYKKNYDKGNSAKYDNPDYWEAYYQAIKIRDADPEYHRRRIAASNAKIAIKISTPAGEFDSISDAARHHDLTSEGMRYRVNSDKYPDYKKIEK
jgi:hypothetical protein